MTERNPLMNRPRSGAAAAFVSVNNEQVPTDLHEYCAWLNRKERRNGVWAVVDDNGRNTIVYRQEAASADWLREKGLLPSVGRAA